MNRSWLVACLAVVMCGTASGAQESYPLSIPAPIGSAAPEHKQYSVRAHDGTKLHVHEWAPPKPAADKPVILFLHGIGMHGEPYASIAHGFTARRNVGCAGLARTWTIGGEAGRAATGPRVTRGSRRRDWVH